MLAIDEIHNADLTHNFVRSLYTLLYHTIQLCSNVFMDIVCWHFLYFPFKKSIKKLSKFYIQYAWYITAIKIDNVLDRGLFTVIVPLQNPVLVQGRHLLAMKRCARCVINFSRMVSVCYVHVGDFCLNVHVTRSIRSHRKKYFAYMTFLFQVLTKKQFIHVYRTRFMHIFIIRKHMSDIIHVST